MAWSARYRSIVTLCAVGGVALAACGSSSPTSAGPGSSTTSAAGTKTAPALNASDQSLNPVTLGYINEDSGSQGQLDSPNGAEAAVKYVNAELGGIDKHPVKLERCSSDGSAEAVQKCAEQFLNDNAVKAVIVGVLQSGDDSLYSTLAGKKPLIGATPATAAAFAATDAYWYGSGSFGVLPGYGVFATGHLTGLKTASILYLDIPSLQATVTGLLEPILTKAHIKTTLVPLSLTATDVVGPLTASGASSTDLLMIITGAPGCVQVAKAVAQLGITAKVVASPICMDQSVLQSVGQQEKGWYEIQIGTGTATPGPALTLMKRILTTYGDGHDGQYAYAMGPVTLSLIKQMQKIGYAALTPASITAAVKSYQGPVPLIAPSIHCGLFPAAPSVCNGYITAYQWDGTKLNDAGNGYIKIG